jgi:DNA modification methylase
VRGKVMSDERSTNWKDTLYFGDNLEVLKKYLPDNLVDLIYIDPPFNSGANYNLLFKPSVSNVLKETAQGEVFLDTWTWSEEAAATYHGIISGTITTDPIPEEVVTLTAALYSFLKTSSMMAYLVMMIPRLVELRRVLKPTGSIYLHCDPTASHYLKLLMDAVFGAENFRNEIVWHYLKWSTGKHVFQKNHDVIFFYTKSKEHTFNQLFMPRAASTIKRFGNARIVSNHDETGKRVPSEVLTQESAGARQDDVWNISRVPPVLQLFPTQKPEALLERIINASSNPGDIVLDAFAGCGTATAVAQKLDRRWIGIDIAIPAIDVIVKRLEASATEQGRYLEEGVDFKVIGLPRDVEGAEALARKYGDGWQFQYWAVTRIPGALGNIKKTGDGGVDGTIPFWDSSKKNNLGKAIISVKSNKVVTPSMVHDLHGAVVANGADFGILVILEEPTKGMRTEALKYEAYRYNGKMNIPMIQLLSAADLFKKPLPLVLPAENMVIDRKKGDSVTVIQKEELPI